MDREKFDAAIAKCSDNMVFSVAQNVDIEDHDHDLNDYDRNDLIEVIYDFVEAGVKEGSWTMDGWIKDVIEHGG